jgi:predicted nuclease of predicted toxin-antitoxin system
MNDPVLIDECLSPELVDIANMFGCEAHHAVRYGLSGKADHIVYGEVERRGFLFVTNNRDDFVELLAGAELHAGMIVILPNCRRAEQVALFRLALKHVIGIGGLMNQVLEIDENGRIEVYDLPK